MLSPLVAPGDGVVIHYGQLLHTGAGRLGLLVAFPPCAQTQCRTERQEHGEVSVDERFNYSEGGQVDKGHAFSLPGSE
jgi:hypothetical protein